MSLLLLFHRRGESLRGTPSRGRPWMVLEEFVKTKNRPKLEITKEDQKKLTAIRKTLKKFKEIGVRNPGLKHDINLINALLNPPHPQITKPAKVKEIQPHVSDLINSIVDALKRDAEDLTLLIIMSDE